MADVPSVGNYNMRNPAVKRILQEVKEMQREQSTEYMSMPLEEDIFEWQFAVHGPKDSEFEGGIYHGRITLPADYPFKPPSFQLLTPSGRFEVQTKICLSISNHHPEHWQPSWSVRTALVALIAFMPTKPNGALGSLDFSKAERRALAIKSRQNPPAYGSPARQKIIQQLHEAMLKTAPLVPTTPLPEDGAPSSSTAHPGNEAPPATPPAASPPPPSTTNAADTATSHAGISATEAANPTGSATQGISVSGAAPNVAAASVAGSSSGGAAGTAPASAGVAGTDEGVVRQRVGRASPPAAPAAGGQVQARAGAAAPESAQEWMLSALAAVLIVAILVVLGQKVARAYLATVGFADAETEL